MAYRGKVVWTLILCGLALTTLAFAKTEKSKTIVTYPSAFAVPTWQSEPHCGDGQRAARGLQQERHGAACLGGVGGGGTAFKLDPAGNETILYAFQFQSGGAEPRSGLIQDAAGNLYGTTIGGDGNVYKLDPQGDETVLYQFTGSDGSEPTRGLTMDSAGNLYGTTYLGGNSACASGLGCGVVFKLDPSGNETVLYSFSGGADGWGPLANLVMDAAGNLYGTATFGGVTSHVCPSGCGVVFKITP